MSWTRLSDLQHNYDHLPLECSFYIIKYHFKT